MRKWAASECNASFSFVFVCNRGDTILCSCRAPANKRSLANFIWKWSKFTLIIMQWLVSCPRASQQLVHFMIPKESNQLCFSRVIIALAYNILIIYYSLSLRPSGILPLYISQLQFCKFDKCTFNYLESFIPMAEQLEYCLHKRSFTNYVYKTR